MTRLLVPLLALAILPSTMRADVGVCTTGTIATVLAQGPCTIGDKTFTFTSYDPYFQSYTHDFSTNTDTYGTGVNGNISAASVAFTPLTTDPNAPGFRLAAAFSSFDSSNGTTLYSSTYEQGNLYFNVATTNHDSRITGTRTTLQESVLTTNLDTTCPAGISCWSQGITLAQSYLNNPFNPTSSVEHVLQNSGVPAIYSGNLPLASPVASASGSARFFTDAENNHYYGSGYSSASASFTSADYLITEIAAVPEPSSVVLLVSMIGLVALTLRRKVRTGAI